MNPALDSRARFEADFFGKTPKTAKARQRNGDGYLYMGPNQAWETWQRAWQAAIASMAVIDPQTGSMAQAYRDLIEGMSVSVDVSTGDDDAGHRYFGTITEVMDDPNDKHHVTLLVQDAAPNFNTNPVLAALAAKETT